MLALSVRVFGVDPARRSMFCAAASNPEYEALVQCFLSGGNPSSNPSSRAIACVWPEGNWLVIPQSAQEGLLRLLHASHSGMVKTYQHACQQYYWPDMKNAISQVIRSDGGHQFQGTFTEFCPERNILHELSSPYNPRSNGLAEAAVKAVKFLLGKCNDAGENFPAALLKHRNTAREDGFSPAESLWGRQQRTLLPGLPGHKFDRDEFKTVRSASRQYKRNVNDRSAHDLSILRVGTKVLMQHQVSNAWYANGTISGVLESGHSYDVVSEAMDKVPISTKSYFEGDITIGHSPFISTAERTRIIC
eukprot:TCALIF_13697-PA protein Name:"Protein of unknown function" AED:0.33 eAED:0.33 QI:0/0/0/0.66/1/1/3/0/304